MSMTLADAVQPDKPYSWFAPAWFQIGGVVWVLIGCLAIRMVLDALPTGSTPLWVQLRLTFIQLVVAGGGVAFAWFLIPQSHVYAVLVGLPCSGMAVQFYAVAFQWLSLTLMPALLSKLSAIVNAICGITPNRPAEPIEFPPASNNPQKPNP